MKAMILAAGLGRRLRPLTDYQPKALVKVGAQPLLGIVIERLKRFGIRDIIINVHHFTDQILKYLKEQQYFGINIEISDERDQLLETGGGLLKAASFFDDGQPFLLCNTDIITDLDLHAFLAAHQANGGLATLAVRHRPTSRYFIFDQAGILNGWINTNTGQVKMCRPAVGELQTLAFSGLHIIDPRIFTMMEAKGKFSIVETYLNAAAEQDIYAYLHDEDTWLDVGRPENLEKAQLLLEEMTKAK